MILDTNPEEFASPLDAGVMGSPWDMYAFYGNSPSDRTAPVSSPGSPESQCDGMTGSPAAEDNLHSNGKTVMTRLPYQGVRVKNPVKELIMQKRSLSSSPNQVGHPSEELSCCPVLMSILKGQKRQAVALPCDVPCPKKPAIYFHNSLNSCMAGMQTASCDVVMQSDGQCHVDSLTDIGDIVQRLRECSPVSIATVQVQGSPLVAPVMQENPFYIPAEPLHAPAQADMSLCQPCYPTYTPPMPLSVSFFEWQIQQEEEKLSTLTPEFLTTRDGDGDTFLHIAVAQGRRALSYVLARKLASFNMLDVKEHNYQSALQVSVAANQHLIVQDLLTLGAQINTADSWGRTPLHVCAEKGHALMLQAIHRTLKTTRQQLDVEAVNYDGLTALHVAVFSHNAVLQELANLPSPQSPQQGALLQRRKLLGECISMLMVMGASYRTRDRKSGRTCLHIAAEEANVEVLRLFLDQPDALLAINDKAYNGNTVLHVASSLQGRVAQVDAVKLLMRKGADPSIKNLENEQPTQLVPDGPTGDQVRRILKGKGSPTRPTSY